MTTQYLSCAETAKLVRAALKESFPGIRFSVRSSTYSMGASINISYTNGPTYDAVKNVVAMFEGAYFDGMTDYKGYNYSSLDGVETSFGANYIFVRRELTVEVMQAAVQAAVQARKQTSRQARKGSQLTMTRHVCQSLQFHVRRKKTNLRAECSHCVCMSLHK